MIIIVYSETTSATIAENFGNPEYSYYFVLKEFLPLLKQLGTVIVVTDPAREVDPIYNRAVKDGERCVFVSFTPPHRTPLGLACPTVPVFAWEFDTIPYETWFGERFQDWRFVLNKFGRAITHSNFSVQTVWKAMGQDFPIVSIPAPVWDRFATRRRPPEESPVIPNVELNVDAAMIDSRTIDWSLYSPQRSPGYRAGEMPQAEKRRREHTRLQIGGVIYTSIVSSYDDRKNCFDMLEGFCWALRECEDATLILKMGHSDSSLAVDEYMRHLSMLTPFKCRVILIDGYLDGNEYERLMRSTTYAVNTSVGEGQCLPLMEYMSYGTPAVAPCHTGMLDYISADNAFVINSTIAPAAWPTDPRGAYRTLSRRIDCESLSRAYRESYLVAKEAPDRYRMMAEHARQTLQRHCSSAVAIEKLRALLLVVPRPVSDEQDYGKLTSRDQTYSLGKVVDFANEFESCRFLLAGWSSPELGYGVWSDGVVAEIALRIKPKPVETLLVRVNLSAYVNAGHPNLSVDVSANEIPLVQWKFNFADPEMINHSWREVLISSEIASHDEIRIKFNIEHPASPLKLGLSSDSRLLGVALHELSILRRPLQADALTVPELNLEDLRLVNAAYLTEISGAQQTISKLCEDISGYQRKLAALEERKNGELRYASWLVEQHKKLVEQQKNELSALRNSKSYRLGHAIVAPLAFVLRSLESMVALIVASLRNPRDALHQMTIQRILRASFMLLRNPRQFRDYCRIHASRLLKGTDLSNGLMPRSRRLTPTSRSDPRVSVLVVNYNGRDHLERLFNSLSGLAFKNHETIMVDNGSTDDSVELVRSRYPKVRIIELKNNIGFAEANNIGFEMSRGDFICLLNNDTRCDPDFLTYLVDVLDSDPMLGAVGPKIRFWSQFLAIEIDVPSAATALLDVGELYKGASDYQKAFFQAGFSEPFLYQGKCVRRISGKAKLLLPEQNVRSGLRLHVFAEASSHAVTVQIGDHHVAHVLKANSWQVIPLSAGDESGVPNWIINNAGSRITKDGNVSDRGFGSADDGYFDVVDEPDALCGCAMLVRREALNDNEPIFAKEFFAYFEDTDLSLRIRRNGYRLAYCPKSVIYHKHASTSGENSTFFKYYVNRNRILFYALHFPEQLWREKLAEARQELASLKQRYQLYPCTQAERDFGQKIDNIFADWDRLLPQIAAGRFYDRKRYFPRLAVYNNFWNTKGGGEYHAGIIAEVLQTLGPVDLISERNFSIEDVERQFDIDLSQCRKVIVSAPELHHDMRVTAQYDVFINSTYASDLISSAKLNLYIVSFPYRIDNRPAGANRFLAAYDIFLANSNYTKEWCRRYWHVDAVTFYPSVPVQHPVPGNAAKTKIILNVGRFFTHGHNKKQLELVEVFKDMMREGKLSPGWKLVLVGQVEYGQEDYYNAVQSAAHGMPVEIYPNILRAELTKLYEQAAIYWHATGLGEDLEKFPDRAEHFGITTVEAMGFGCVPVVIGDGGQLEIVEDNTSGYLFTDVNDLKEKTATVAKAFEHDPNGTFLALSSKARARAAEFSKERAQARFLALLASARGEQTMGDQQPVNLSGQAPQS